MLQTLITEQTDSLIYKIIKVKNIFLFHFLKFIEYLI